MALQMGEKVHTKTQEGNKSVYCVWDLRPSKSTGAAGLSSARALEQLMLLRPVLLVWPSSEGRGVEGEEKIREGKPRAGCNAGEEHMIIQTSDLHSRIFKYFGFFFFPFFSFF